MEPRRVHEVIHTLRQKPLHVRENIAIGVASGSALVVLLGWVAVNVMSGTFSLNSNTLASGHAADVSHAVTTGTNNVSQLLGAAGAAFGATSSPAAITVVDTQVHSTFDDEAIDASATVIHF